ncbi:hypothetical protein IDM40_20610 [Nocardiopsis sp. HNM0947]|uniref:DUF5709 domain-containing protein n=1 Tax=Nocardiopsis coralli TaxID=2772213 RepID=A0ABR9PB54_9ACTN|nr:hypothetical protein [Nocardiopsis coralli]MBE3001075.1 hypothetical protein [Nocardiopsis coralli]
MSEQPYNVDSDMGDDPQESEVAEAESRMDAPGDDAGYTFVEDDTSEARGISEEVRDERGNFLAREDWDLDGEAAESEAVNEVDPDREDDW